MAMAAARAVFADLSRSSTGQGRLEGDFVGPVDHQTPHDLVPRLPRPAANLVEVCAGLFFSFYPTKS